MASIQILGIRRFFSKKLGKEITSERFFEKNWRAPSVIDLFKNTDKYLKEIPEKEQVNLYYTAAQCKEEKGRKLVTQNIMPFDVDELDIKYHEKYIDPVCETLGIKKEETGIIYSGNGLQFIIGIKKPITEESYFELNRIHYKAICEKITSRLKALGLPGKADASVFSPARLLRMPKTTNDKTWKGLGVHKGKLYFDNIVPIEYDIRERSGIPLIPKSDQISGADYKRQPSADTPYVLKECLFLKHCNENQSSISEAEWYAMLSITGRLDSGNKLSHEMSKDHPGYSHAETESKLEQALEASGPRTCKGIQSLWGGCTKCPHFEKVNSPILLRGADFIETESTGFHKEVISKNGQVRSYPRYEDLRRFFYKKNKYLVVAESEICMIYNGTHWEDYPDSLLKAFAQDHFDPIADTRKANEFKNIVTRKCTTRVEWFKSSTVKKINFQNGVLDIDTMKLLPHSHEFGFTYVLPYAYDCDAKAPGFEEFMGEVTGNDAAVTKLLMEFAGYCFSNDSCWAEKALILTGQGANGKSTFMNVLKALAGEQNYASLSLSDLKDQTNRRQLDGALFNLAEETPSYGMKDASFFKNLVTGGEMIVKQLYKQPYSVANRCKFIFACNDLPKTQDTSKGYFRRLLIVRFDQVFEGDKKDPFKLQKLLGELPGVFNLVINAYRELEKRKRFEDVAAVARELDRYTLEIDSVKAWYEDCVQITDSENEVLVEQMYSAYKFFSEDRGEDPVSYKAFAMRLSLLIPGFITKRKRRRDEKGARLTYLTGIIFSGGQSQ